MPKLNDDIPYSLPKLLQRYRCSRDVLAGWLAANIAEDHKGNPCTLLEKLETVGYKKKQSYFTHKQWMILTDHLDPILLK
jgi:hypothetical protein